MDMEIFKAPQKVREGVEQKVVGRLAHRRNSAFERFPLFFTLLATFGVVATFYGFERLIDKVDWLANNPYILLTVGILTLVVTGSLYKKL
jgi:surface polysaccharide O-acyltransferase-like enzyme